jgi:hypothetical protein
MRFESMWFSLLLAASACRSDPSCVPESEELPEGRSSNEGASLDDCPGHPAYRDFAAECEGVSPRLVVTVRDETGPVANALVYPFPQTLRKVRVDPVRFPEVNGTEQTIGYDACTDEQGVAVICGFEDPAAITQLRVVKRGHAFFHTGPFALTSTSVVQVPVSLTSTPAEDHRILVMSCEPHHREPTLLQRANVDFVMAPIGTVIDRLPEFDTLLIGFACNKHESFNELLTRDGNAALFQWVRDGGHLFFAQQNDSKWSRETGCACQAKACPEQILPPEYRFKLLPENDKCNDYRAASVVLAEDPLVREVPTWEGWSYHEQIAPSETRSFVCLDCIDGTSLGAVWSVVLRAEPIADEPKSSCPSWNGGAYDLAATHVALMHAIYGDGMIVVAHHAWEQGSEGESIGAAVDANAKLAREAVIDFLTGRR